MPRRKASGPPRYGDGPVGLVLRGIDSLVPVPWQAAAGSTTCAHRQIGLTAQRPKPLYTPQQRLRRDASKWTLVQGVLAPVQFLVFLVSLFLVIHYLESGEGHGAATASVLIKTGVLYLIMITGAIWEKVVFDKWLFAESFFWEDVFSMLVLTLHTAYVGAVLLGLGSPEDQMWLALAAYATYVINAAQFVWKLRMARLEAGRETVGGRSPQAASPAMGGGR